MPLGDTSPSPEAFQYILPLHHADFDGNSGLQARMPAFECSAMMLQKLL
jgi:hypothetical protein